MSVKQVGVGVGTSSLTEIATSCNITPETVVYVAIGSANNSIQQFPPFLSKFKENIKNIVVILIDPCLELPPQFISSNEYVGTGITRDQNDPANSRLGSSRGITPNSTIYFVAGEKLTIYACRVNFDFDTTNESSDSFGFILKIINRIIDTKKSNPNGTCLLFVADYGGYDLLTFGDNVRDHIKHQLRHQWEAEFKNIYQNNILFGLHPFENTGCCPDLTNVLYHPILCDTPNNGTLIYNLRYVPELEYLIILSVGKSNSIPVAHICTYYKSKLDKFSHLVNNYRQAIMHAKGDSRLAIVPDIDNRLTIETEYHDVSDFRGNKIRLDILCQALFKNMKSILAKNIEIIGWFNGIDIDYFFGDFFRVCLDPTTDPYKYHNSYTQCAQKLYTYICEIRVESIVFNMDDYIDQQNSTHKILMSKVING